MNDIIKVERGENTHEIAFIICSNNDMYSQECRKYIGRLHIPADMKVSVMEVKGARSMTSGYNESMYKSKARYKVYLHQDVFILNKNFIFDVLKCFEKDEKLGMIGVEGARKTPIDACLFDAIDIGGCCSVGIFEDYGIIGVNYPDIKPKELYEEVECIDGMLMITSYDVPWDEEVEGFHFYDLSQCMRFKKNQIKIAVARQEEIWAFHDMGTLDYEKFEKCRQKFCMKYTGYSYVKNEKDLSAYIKCKEIVPLLYKVLLLGKKDVALDVITELRTDIHFNLELMMLALILEINIFEEKSEVSSGSYEFLRNDFDYDKLLDQYQKFRLKVIEAKNELPALRIIVDAICTDEYSLESVLITTLHNVTDPEDMLVIIGKLLDKSGKYTFKFVLQTIRQIKQFEMEKFGWEHGLS